MGMPSATELLIILAIVALIFGTKKLKSIGGDLGGAVKGFKKALNDDEEKAEELKEEAKDELEDVAAKVKDEEVKS